MSTTLTPFDFTGQQVRVVVDMEGEPWFVAADVATVLDLGNPRSSLALLDEDEKGVHSVDTPGGTQQVTIVSESGLYSLVLRSRKAEAKAFKRWITRDVLPTIRRTGSFTVQPAAFAIPQTMSEALRLAADEHDRANIAEAKVAELEPKADLADTFLTADGTTRLIREVAKLLSWRERDLRRWLVEQRLLFVKHAACGDVQYDFRAEFAHHFVAKEVPVQHAFGTCSHYTIRVTARGIELIRKRIREQSHGRALALPA